MYNAYIVTGTLTDERTVTLDEDLPLKPTRVQLVVEPVKSSSANSYAGVMASIRERQIRRGHRARTGAEVDASLQQERESWDN